MKNFDFTKIRTFNELLELKARLGKHAVLVAGATCIMNDIRMNALNNVTLADISDVDAPRMKGIALDSGKLCVGALVKISELVDSKEVAQNAPALSMAAHVFADPITRNSATIGGNVAYASPSADTVAPLMVHDAVAVLAHQENGCTVRREVAMSEFYTGLKKTCVEPNEVIECFMLECDSSSAYLKLGLRKSMSISVVTAAARANVKDGALSLVRIALGSVASTVVRAYGAENALLGRPWNKLVALDAASSLSGDISPIDDIRATGEYRSVVAPTLVRRAINLALYGECNFKEDEQ